MTRRGRLKPTGHSQVYPWLKKILAFGSLDRAHRRHLILPWRYVEVGRRSCFWFLKCPELSCGLAHPRSLTRKPARRHTRALSHHDLKHQVVFAQSGSTSSSKVQFRA